jgi:chemotaxis methyl-accepting protein methylase
MLLAEAGLNDQSIMVGADCRADAIRKAQAGIYSSASLQSMESALLQKYFRSSGAHYQIVDYLRQNAQWRVSNLLSGVEKGPWDIILWRNMAIYLNPEFATQIWTALIKELRPGGYLVVGRAEQPPSSLGLIFKSRCIYQLLSQAILGS